MNPHSPNKFKNVLRQNIFFLILREDTSFFFLIISLSFVFFFFVIIRYYWFLQKLFYYCYFIFFFFHENYFYFFMFRDVPGCSGMFRNVPCSGFYRQPGNHCTAQDRMTYESSKTDSIRWRPYEGASDILAIGKSLVGPPACRHTKSSFLNLTTKANTRFVESLWTLSQYFHFYYTSVS